MDEHLALRKALNFYFYFFLATERNHLILFFKKVAMSKTDWGGRRSGESLEVMKSNRSMIQEHIMVFLPNHW